MIHPSAAAAAVELAFAAAGDGSISRGSLAVWDLGELTFSFWIVIERGVDIA